MRERVQDIGESGPEAEGNQGRGSGRAGLEPFHELDTLFNHSLFALKQGSKGLEPWSRLSDRVDVVGLIKDDH